MKRTIGTLMFFLAFSISTNVESKMKINEEATFESCVSIASELTADRPDLFELAYNWCIYQRCGCDM